MPTKIRENTVKMVRGLQGVREALNGPNARKNPKAMVKGKDWFPCHATRRERDRDNAGRRETIQHNTIQGYL